MAKRLVSVHSRRKRKARRGILDVRSTIRANQEYDGILFETVWKKTKVDRPKIVALCDVSGSVANVSRFLKDQNHHRMNSEAMFQSLNV